MKPFFSDKVSGSVGITSVENEAIMCEDRKVAATFNKRYQTNLF